MVQSGVPYTFTTNVSGGRTYSGVTVPAGGGWLTLRFDGTFAISGSSDNLLHVLVQAETGGGIPNITVNAVPSGGGSAEVLTSDSQGMCVFTVTATPIPQPFPWGVFVAFGIVGVAVAVMYWRKSK